MKKIILLFLILLTLACTQGVINEQPVEKPFGILVDNIPLTADVIFTSLNYLVEDLECLDSNYNTKNNFITDPDCNSHIYSHQLRQVFVLDIETGLVTQVTNTDCYYVSAQAINTTTLMVNAICNDTNGDGLLTANIGNNDENHLYLIDLTSKEMNCLTCDEGLTSINNPDYSNVNKKIVFSASLGFGANRLFTINADKELKQLTNNEEYWDFDCSWSEDGEMIVMSRLPKQDSPFTIPSEVWMMNSDGSGLEKVTSGGLNVYNETGRLYPVGIDADPDFSSDNTQIVLSRLRTELENEPFGVYELVIIDLNTREEIIIDSSYANMVPEWKTGGIIFTRQEGVEDYMSDPMSVKQSMYLYNDGVFTELEDYPYNVFPLGGLAVSWI